MRRLFRGDVLLFEKDGCGFQGNFCWFCPKCGDIWGRLTGPGDYHAVTWECKAHASRYRVGGSFIGSLVWWTPFGGEDGVCRFLLNEPGLLKWEFEVHLHWMEVHGPEIPNYKEQLIFQTLTGDRHHGREI